MVLRKKHGETKSLGLLVSPLGIVQVATQIVNVPNPPPFMLAMLPSTNKNCVEWDARSPLIVSVAPTILATILVFALKAIPKFTKDGSKTPTRHLQDVADICLVHRITAQNVALRLLVASFRGKALDWYCTLPADTINT